MKCEFLEKSNVIADHTLNLSMKQLKTQKMKKKMYPPIYGIRKSPKIACFFYLAFGEKMEPWRNKSYRDDYPLITQKI